MAAVEAEYVAKREELERAVESSRMDADGKAAGTALLAGFLSVLAE